MKDQFPLFQNHPGLAYLDNGATTQKPQSVIDAMEHFYTKTNSNIHRGVYKLSQEATDLYEGARKTVADFINASENEIIFTKGTTESINLIASTFGQSKLQKGDEILLTEMEHHANIIPWQLICEQTGASVKTIPLTESGELDLSNLNELLTERTKLVALVHISNTLGTVNPIKTIIDQAHKQNIPVLVDGAQAIAHMPIDVKELDVDFYAFSGHKMYGPTGIGVLYGKEALLNSLPPYQGGGDMIERVSFEGSTFKEAPFRFEAGTPPIAQAVGLAEAVKFIQRIGFETIQSKEEELLTYAAHALTAIEGLRIIGTADHKAGIISFVLDQIHPHDMGTILDQEDIAVRTGHHCTQPIMQRYKIQATTRASFAVYNTKEDIDKLVDGIKKAQSILL